MPSIRLPFKKYSLTKQQLRHKKGFCYIATEMSVDHKCKEGSLSYYHIMMMRRNANSNYRPFGWYRGHGSTNNFWLSFHYQHPCPWGTKFSEDNSSIRHNGSHGSLLIRGWWKYTELCSSNDCQVLRCPIQPAPSFWAWLVTWSKFLAPLMFPSSFMFSKR